MTWPHFFRFVGGGHSGFLAFLNAGVHTVMYLYYLLAACGPGIQKYLWWKRSGEVIMTSDLTFPFSRYLTRLQMVQFIGMILHGMLPMYYDCGYPKIMPAVTIWFLWSSLIRK